jgi:hypothetical protein
MFKIHKTPARYYDYQASRLRDSIARAYGSYIPMQEPPEDIYASRILIQKAEAEYLRQNPNASPAQRAVVAKILRDGIYNPTQTSEETYQNLEKIFANSPIKMEDIAAVTKNKYKKISDEQEEIIDASKKITTAMLSDIEKEERRRVGKAVHKATASYDNPASWSWLASGNIAPELHKMVKNDPSLIDHPDLLEYEYRKIIKDPRLEKKLYDRSVQDNGNTRLRKESNTLAHLTGKFIDDRKEMDDLVAKNITRVKTKYGKAINSGNQPTPAIQQEYDIITKWETLRSQIKKKK